MHSLKRLINFKICSININICDRIVCSKQKQNGFHAINKLYIFAAYYEIKTFEYSIIDLKLIGIYCH